MQREFAQNSIRWKIADAAAAGLSPLAAIGGQGYSASPSFVASPASRSMSDMVRGMGQNISRSVAATQTLAERKLAEETLRGIRLENDLKDINLKTAIRNLSANPPMPTYGMYGSNAPGGGTTADAMFGRSDPVQANVSIPPVSSITFEVTRTGLRPQPSQQLAQANQNSMISSLSWDIDNKVVPFIMGSHPQGPPSPIRYPLPAGYNYWKWNRWAGEYQPAKSVVDPRAIGHWRKK